MLNDTQVFHPLGFNIMHINGFSLDGFLAVPLIFLGGHIFAYNIISVLSLALSAFTAYILAYEADCRAYWAALFSALAHFRWYRRLAISVSSDHSGCHFLFSSWIGC